MMKDKKGFTLIELLVVMAILALLAAIGLGTFNSSRLKGRDSKRKNDLAQIEKALEMYYNDHGEYPGVGDYPAGESAFQDENNTLYMKEMPTDSKFGDYPYETDGTYYKIYARLENERDPGIGSYPGTTCGDDECNYAVASPNALL
jgi:prepilin-type N-terminal cleavage/methylation domain-containing protein